MLSSWSQSQWWFTTLGMAWQQYAEYGTISTPMALICFFHLCFVNACYKVCVCGSFAISRAPAISRAQDRVLSDCRASSVCL